MRWVLRYCCDLCPQKPTTLPPSRMCPTLPHLPAAKFSAACSCGQPLPRPRDRTGRGGTGPRAGTPHPLSSWPKGSAIAGSLPPSGDGAVTYGALWVLGEDEAVDMSHSHSIEHGAPVWTECSGHQGPEVELEEGQVILRRLRVAFQGHRQLRQGRQDMLRIQRPPLDSGGMEDCDNVLFNSQKTFSVFI